MIDRLRLGASPILPDQSGGFRYADDGPCALLIEVETASGEVIDQIAYLAEEPYRWWLLKGTASLLGEPDLALAALSGAALRLVETPADWLKTAPPAACVVCWTAPLLRALAEVARLECASRRLAWRLRRKLAEEARLPKIVANAA